MAGTPERNPGGQAAAVRAGDRRGLARAITLVESTRDDHRARAIALLDELGEPAIPALRLGISGPPGVGKSTFIEALGAEILAQGHRLAVLAVDPSSARSGGSILGDKTRMAELGRDERAFIRPSPAGTTLGGVARRTRETIALCEAAGYDVVIVETVGVGQSETAVADMTDLFALLLLPSGGDELQGIKRGIVELAQLVFVNKADGDLRDAAGRTAADYASALRLLRGAHDGWEVEVATCSALRGEGIGDAWASARRYWSAARASGALERKRAAQAHGWMQSEVSEGLMRHLLADPAAAERWSTLEEAVSARRISPSSAVYRMIGSLTGRLRADGADMHSNFQEDTS